MTKKRILLGWLLCLLCATAQAELRNELAGHPSPYLALHAEDPVHWQDWSPETLALAKAQDKLLFLSVGYYSCYWCHVMQRESFRNPEIAALLNTGFIPVKVDRELEPVLDGRLMNFMNETRGIGGWPLNVFLTPQGDPLVGVVYLPADEFHYFLKRLKQRWEDEHDSLRYTAAEAAKLIAQRHAERQKRAEKTSNSEIIQGFVMQAMRIADDLSGGFGNQAKFPSVPQLSTLLNLYTRSPDEGIKQFLLLTLENMARQGLRDHLAGGFFRYTVDPHWQVPHFEKMLYGNALLAELYLRAGEVFQRSDFVDVGLDTLDFIRREMAGGNGAYIAALSAVDDKDVEGGYYLWSEEELKALLTDDEWAVARVAWGLDQPPALEEGRLPVQSRTLAQTADTLKLEQRRIEALLRSAKTKLVMARAKRALPRDEKYLAGWNGLALSAFAAGARQGNKGSAEAGQRLRDFILGELWSRRVLKRAVDAQGRDLGPGRLEDYAYVARGLLDWARYTGEATDYSVAAYVARAAWRRFYTKQGWRQADDSLLPAEEYYLQIVDGPLPSPSATLIAVSDALAEHFEDKYLRAKVKRASEVYSQGLVAEPFFHATKVSLLDHGRGSQPETD